MKFSFLRLCGVSVVFSVITQMSLNLSNLGKNTRVLWTQLYQIVNRTPIYEFIQFPISPQFVVKTVHYQFVFCVSYMFMQCGLLQIPEGGHRLPKLKIRLCIHGVWDSLCR